MPGFNKHTRAYSAADILRYLKGEMSPQQMYALEKAALKDPFLAEAIEGFEGAISSTGEENIRKELQSLKAGMDKRSSSKIMAISNYSWIKIAAAAVVIIAAGIFTYTSLLPSPDGSVLAEQKTTSMQEAPSPALKKNDAAAAATIEKSRAIPPPPPTPEREETMKPVLSSKQKTPGVNNDVGAIRKKNRETFSEKEAEQEEDAHAGRTDSIIVRGYASAPANALQKESSTAARKAGMKEKKELPAAVSSDAMISKELSGKAAGIAITKDAVPKPGWAAFDQYITANKKMALDDTVKNGEVVLSFRVRGKGKPENITVEKSLSAFYDKEAIRLLGEGPSWKLLKSGKAKVSVTIHF